MKRDRLLLITASYPYGKGEEFLETEILYLARSFDVVIVPLSRSVDNAQHRPLPAGVMVRPEIIQALPVGWRNTWLWLLRHPLKVVRIVKILLRECERLRCRPTLLSTTLRFVIFGMRFGALLAESFRGQRLAIVYSYWLTVSALAGAVLREKGIAKIAISRAHRGDLYHEYAPQGYLVGQAPTIAHLDKVFCISEHGFNYLKAHHPEHCYKIELSRLGVRPAPVRNAIPTDGRLHIVSCAYLSPVKRIELLIKALMLCSVPVTWTHLGGGALEGEMRSMAEKLPGNIQWRITGALPNQEILQFYQENPVDLFINVSESEGLPVSIMEALSYGIPVAATDVGGNKELVFSGKNGFLLPSNLTPEILTQTLVNFYQLSASQKQVMRQEAWNAWRSNVNAETQYTNFVQRLILLTEMTE